AAARRPADGSSVNRKCDTTVAFSGRKTRLRSSALVQAPLEPDLIYLHPVFLRSAAPVFLDHSPMLYDNQSTNIMTKLQQSFSALNYRNFRFFLVIRFLLTFAAQMQITMLGFYVYQLTHSKIAIAFSSLDVRGRGAHHADRVAFFACRPPLAQSPDRHRSRHPHASSHARPYARPRLCRQWYVHRLLRRDRRF